MKLKEMVDRVSHYSLREALKKNSAYSTRGHEEVGEDTSLMIVKMHWSEPIDIIFNTKRYTNISDLYTSSITKDIQLSIAPITDTTTPTPKSMTVEEWFGMIKSDEVFHTLRTEAIRQGKMGRNASSLRSALNEITWSEATEPIPGYKGLRDRPDSSYSTFDTALSRGGVPLFYEPMLMRAGYSRASEKAVKVDEIPTICKWFSTIRDLYIASVLLQEAEKQGILDLRVPTLYKAFDKLAWTKCKQPLPGKYNIKDKRVDYYASYSLFSQDLIANKVELITNRNNSFNTPQTNQNEKNNSTNQQAGNTIKVPAKSPSISTGERVTGRRISGKFRPSSVAVGHLSNKEVIGI